jgi:hypothetical protein
MASNKPRYPSIDFVVQGRYVLGDLTKLQTQDNEGREKKHPSYFIAVAVHKGTPGIDDINRRIIGHTIGVIDSVQGAAQIDPRTQQLMPGCLAERVRRVDFVGKNVFAWKIRDGDADPKWSQREGCQNSWIYIYNTLYPIACANVRYEQIDPHSIKCGDYVAVASSCEFNGEMQGTAGLFMNPNRMLLVQDGPLIVPVGKSTAELFAGYVPTAPIGAPASPTQGYGQNPAQYGGQVHLPPQQPAPAQQQTYAQPAGYGNAGAPAPAGAYGAPAHSPQPQPAYIPPPNPAGVQGAPAGAALAQPAPAPYTGQGGYPATAYPSSPTPAHGAPQPAPAPAMGQYQQPSAGYPQAAGQPGTHIPQGGTAMPVYPSSGQFVNGPQYRQ